LTTELEMLADSLKTSPDQGVPTLGLAFIKSGWLRKVKAGVSREVFGS